MPNPFWNRKEKRLRAGWRLVGLVLLQLALLVLVGFLIGLAAPSLDLGPATGAASGLIGVGSFAVTAVLAVWFAGRLLDRRPFADFGFHFDRRWWLDFAFGFVLGALIMSAIFLTELAAGWITVTGLFVTQSGSMPFATAILVPLGLFIFVGLEEELLLRGYVLHNLAEGLSFRPFSGGGAVAVALVLSSIVFGFLHILNPNVTFLSLVNLVLAGLLLGLGYILTGELAIPIGLHISWNFFQGGIFGFPVSGNPPSAGQLVRIDQGGPEVFTGGAFGPEGGLLVTILSCLAAAIVLLWVRYTRGEVRLAGSIPQPPGYDSQGPEIRAGIGPP